MKKVLSLIAILCMALVCFAACYFPETPCEHDWINATCTAPKTCSVCGETDGEPIGHTEETVVGTAATCTESGMSDGKKCTVCGETTVQQTVIAALGHTEETVAGTPATCTVAGMTDGKKCSVCGVTTVEQTDIDALGHAPEADDGDITTPVKCANEGCDEILVAAKEAITLTIPEFANGAVVTDKKNYAIGDTVKLTINPEWGYAQKLYINGEPLILDWNNNIYSFVAENDTYVLSGTFELSLDLDVKDATRWETGNQAHGVFTTYYPSNGDSWWIYIKGNYSSITVKAKNYLPVEESMDGNGKDGYQQLLSMTINGKLYAFRIYNDKGTYAVSCTAVSGSVSGWGNWKKIDDEAAAAMNGDGVDFKLERDGNNLIVSVNGKVYITYTMDGVTAEDEVTSVGIQNNFNKGIYVDVPFALTNACEHNWVDATCTTPKTCSKCNVTVGEELGHSYAYVSNNDATCTEDGTKTGACVCGDEKTVVDEGSATGHKNDNDDYLCDICGANLCTDHAPEADDGDCTTAIKCSVCGTVTTEAMEAHTPEADDEDLATAVKCANTGCEHICVPAIVIPTFENGTVTADKTSYNFGDTVTLTITPEAGYFQKLYINGEPLILDWKTFKYSFVVTENAYEITGSFERGLSLKPGDWGRWDDHNQLHGILNTYYPSNGDSWWMDINGEYKSVEITAKNLVPKANSMDGNGNNGYMQIIRFGLSNGKTYAFRIYNDKGDYAVSCTAVSGSSSGWGNWKKVESVLGYSIDNAMAGDGVQFKVERTSADTMTISINGVVMFTYKMDGVTEADKVTFVGIQSNANSGKYVEIPFELN